MELRTLAHFAIHPEATAVHFDKMFGDGQTKAGASGFPGAGNIHAVETLKDARLIGPRDADASVGHSDNNFGVSFFGAEHDLSARQGVLDCVIQKILQNFGETPAVSGDVRQALRSVHGDAQVFFGGAALGRLEATFD
jgi:hypothetical protein